MLRWFGVATIAAATALLAGSGARDISASAAVPATGASLFETNCSSCHGATGLGMADAVPPLAHNPVVVGDPARVIHIVKNGLDGRLVVGGASYDGRMPAWKGVLHPNQIAAVITFIRSAWGNKAGAVSVAQVNAVK